MALKPDRPESDQTMPETSQNDTKSINSKTKKDIPAGLWTKCEACDELLYQKALQENLSVCTKCEFHFTIDSKQRIALTLDEKSFQEWDAQLSSKDPLNFCVPKPYAKKVVDEQKKCDMFDACVTGEGKIEGHRVAIGVSDTRFMMGSMGSVVGEKLTRLIERATKEKLPVIIISASGGARMQEGMFSLMQMAKTSAALMKLDEAGGLFISVLTHPTTAGVLASYATLGDIIIAEPKALIGFTGQRVIESTIRQKLPDGFQRSEFLLEHGLVDMIVHRREMRQQLARLIEMFRVAR